MSDEEHAALAKALNGAKGKVSISGYQCKVMDELYRDWRFIETPTNVRCSVKKSISKVK